VELVCLDRLDGGFSFLVRIPGFLSMDSKGMKADCYIPPREMADPAIRPYLQKILQYFTRYIGTYHIQKLKKRYSVSNVTKPLLADFVRPKAPRFPNPIELGSCHYRFVFDISERRSQVRFP
jgi:hypothetical protein